MQFEVLVQVAVAEARGQAQNHENALERAHTTEQDLQQRYRQLDEQLQVECSATMAWRHDRTRFPSPCPVIIQCAAFLGRTGCRYRNGTGCLRPLHHHTLGFFRESTYACGHLKIRCRSLGACRIVMTFTGLCLTLMDTL